MGKLDREVLTRVVREAIQRVGGDPDEPVLFNSVRDSVEKALVEPPVMRLVMPKFSGEPGPARMPLDRQASLLAMVLYDEAFSTWPF